MESKTTEQHTTKPYRLGVLGAGTMGMAIAEGAVKAGLLAPTDILLCNRSAEKRAQHAQRGYAVTAAVAPLYTDCDMLLLAVKPQNFPEILPQLAAAASSAAAFSAAGSAAGSAAADSAASPAADSSAEESTSGKPLVISIAAGVPFARIEAALGADTPIIRVMPNTPLLLGVGATQLVRNAAASDEQLQRVRTLFDAMGITVVFDQEAMLNEVIPYAGSAPAYLYAFADAMIQSAKTHGIAEQDALTLFAQTMLGAAQMLLQRKQTPAELIQAVCSPGGTTLAGMKVLEDRDFYGLIAAMCDQCIARAYELGG